MRKSLFWMSLVVVGLAALGSVSTASASVGIDRAALSFDGIDDKVTTNLNIDQSPSSTGATFEAWVKPTNLSYGWHNVISTNNTGYAWGVAQFTDVWYVTVGGKSMSTGLKVDANVWQHVSAVFTPGTGVTFYKNNQKVILNSIGYNTLDANVMIGAAPQANKPGYFGGVIDNVMIWNKPLTQDEVQYYMYTRAEGYEAGLIGYWNFNTEFGQGQFAQNIMDGTNAILGSNANVENSDPTWVSEKTDYVVSKALSFDGINDVVTTGLNIDQSANSAGATFSAWVKPTNLSPGWHNVISTNNGGYAWGIANYGGDWVVTVGGKFMYTGLKADSDTWQFVASVFTPGVGVTFYKNNQSVNLNSIGYNTLDANVMIGAAPQVNKPGYFGGVIDSVRVWQFALTANDINFIMNESTLLLPSAVGAWKFDEGNGQQTENENNYIYATLGKTLQIENSDPTWTDGHIAAVQSGSLAVQKSVVFIGNSTVPNATNVKIGQYMLSAGNVEDVIVNQLNVGFRSGLESVQNLTLRDSSTGIVLGNVLPVVTSNNLFALDLRILKGASATVDVYADIVPFMQPNTIQTFTPSVGVSAIGTASGVQIVTTPAGDVDGQTNVVEAAPILTVALGASTPNAQNYLMGATDQTIASYTLNAGSVENLVINSLVFSGLADGNSVNLIKNVRLYDENGVQIGSAVAGLSQRPGSNYADATFDYLNFIVVRGSIKTVVVKADIWDYEDSGYNTTGQLLIPVLLSDQNVIRATGASSGTVVSIVLANNSVGDQLAGSYANTMTFYRSKIAINWSTDTPTGLAVPNHEQMIGKINVSNLANAGAYSATIKYFNVELGSDIVNANVPHILKIYKDSVATEPLAVYEFAAGQYFDSTQISDGDFRDVEISSGSTKTFFVTLDTSSAVLNNYLMIKSYENRIHWSDGVTSDIGISAPLNSKSFNY